MILSDRYKTIGIYLELCKVKLSFFSAFSAFTGFMLAADQLSGGIIFLLAGVFLLACGSSALNQYEERDVDAIMERTKGRPIPTGRIKPLHALYFSLILILIGSFILLLRGGLSASLLGFFALIWYNGLYTYLKRKSAFALIPGAIIGSIPPAIGWVSGGGSLSDTRIWAICFFFLMWQVPHFWLLILYHGEEYEKAGLPSLTTIFTRVQLIRIIFNWILATAVSVLFISANGIIKAPILNFPLIAASLWLVWGGIRLFKERGNFGIYRHAFGRMNSYLFIIMLLLSLDRPFNYLLQLVSSFYNDLI